VPKNDEVHQQILDEAHLSRYSIHPGSTKMYHDLKQHYWWTKMKIEIARYVARCDTCRRVNTIPQPSNNDLLTVGINRYSNVLSVAIELYRLTLSDAVSGVGINV
jgi:hypothetical protein